MTTMMETLPRWAGWRVRIETAGELLDAELTRPAGAKGLVLSALPDMDNPMDQHEADYLHSRGLATLRLSAQDDDPVRLSQLLFGATLWIDAAPECSGLPLGLFGKGQGAAAALGVAALLGSGARAVVVRSGRPDREEPLLARLQAPTLFILGGQDSEGILLNRLAYRRIPASKAFCVVPDATARFEDAEAHQEAAELAAAWFLEQLALED